MTLNKAAGEQIVHHGFDCQSDVCSLISVSVKQTMPKDVVIHVQTLIQNSQNSRFLRFESNGHTGFLRPHGIVFEFEHTFVLSFAYIEYFFITRIDKGIDIMSEGILHRL